MKKTIMPDFYNTSDFQPERTKKRKPYSTKKHRNQEIIDEAENTSRLDRLITLVLVVGFLALTVLIIVGFLKAIT